MGKFQIFPDGRAAGSAPVSGSDFVTKDYLTGSLPEQIWVRGAGEGSAVLSGSSYANWTGPYAIAAGTRVSATGSYSHAEGYETKASGSYSHAEGNGTITSGNYSHAEGDHSVALGANAHAEGDRNLASGVSSHAEGSYTTSSGNEAHSEGYKTVATGSYSHAEGHSSRANNSAHAEGFYTNAFGAYSHAEGSGSKATGTCSHAEGQSTEAINNYEHAQGRWNRTGSNQIFSVGVGHNNLNRKNAISIITGFGATPSASIYIYGVGTYNGTNPETGVNDIATVISNLTGSIASASYSSTDKKIYFFNAGGTASAEIDATDFIKDGMVDSVEVSGSYLVLTFNTDAGKEPVSMSLTRIFNPDNFYTKTDVDTLLSTMSVGDVNVIEAVEFNGTASTINNKVASINVELPAAPNQDAENWVTENSASLVTESIWVRGTGEGSAQLGTPEVTASGKYAVAFGSCSSFTLEASGVGSFAHGNRKNIASGDFSHVEGGEDNKAVGKSSHAEGTSTTASGSYSHAEGWSAIASGMYSHAEGAFSVADGRFSHAEGNAARTSAEGAHAEGYRTTASGEYSHAEGSMSVASGNYSHAEGNHTRASGTFSHTEGYYTGASGSYSHAEGFSTRAVGSASHAEGSASVASGDYSHAEGRNTVASGYISHAEGQATVASSDYSHAEGTYTSASNYSEHAQGKYNATASKQIFSVGVGDTNARRKNAVSIITGSGTVPSASIYIYGVGTYDGTNPQPGVNDIATVISASAGGGSDALIIDLPEASEILSSYDQEQFPDADSKWIFTSSCLPAIQEAVANGRQVYLRYHYSNSTDTGEEFSHLVLLYSGSEGINAVFVQPTSGDVWYKEYVTIVVPSGSTSVGYNHSGYVFTNSQLNVLGPAIEWVIQNSASLLTSESDPVYLADSASLKNAATWVGSNSASIIASGALAKTAIQPAATASWDTAASQSHTHSNGSLLNSLTNAKTGSWDGAATSATALNSISASLIASGTLAKNVTAITASLVASASVAKTASSSAAALSAKSASWDAKVGLPTVTAADNGKILRVVNGAWTLVDPVTVYSGQGAPDSALGQDGDIYLQS